MPSSGPAVTRGDIAELRNDLHRHQDDDREDFRILRLDVASIKEEIAAWSGGLNLAKWAMGLGLPAIFGAVVTHVVRHWNG